jgi:RNA polymerase sigma factor (sigma-70 family)
MNESSINDDSKLLYQISLGSWEAFTKLYKLYAPRLHNFIYPFANQSTEDTEEVMQEIFLKLWTRKEKLSHIVNIETYLLRMAKNQLIDLRKRTNGIHVSFDAFPSVVSELSSDTTYGNLVFAEYMLSAEKAIVMLTPQRKRIFVMRTQDEMSIEEISLKLNISRSAVKKQLYESIAFVKMYIKKKNGWPFAILLAFLL